MIHIRVMELGFGIVMEFGGVETFGGNNKCKDKVPTQESTVVAKSVAVSCCTDQQQQQQQQ
jgi:hypothetical protein